MTPNIVIKSGRSISSSGLVYLRPNFIVFQVVKYIEDNPQRILMTVLESKASTSCNFDEPRERPLKTKILYVYRSKSHMDCYNFIPQCKELFATSGARCLNQVLFATIFLKDQTFFRWQQQKQNVEANIIVPIVQDNFKTFLHQSLSKSRVFMSVIQRKIRTVGRYQLEKVIDKAPHLEYLQGVLKDYDVNNALSENFLICNFQDRLIPSICAQIDKRNRDLVYWQEVIK